MLVYFIYTDSEFSPEIKLCRWQSAPHQHVVCVIHHSESTSVVLKSLITVLCSYLEVVEVVSSIQVYAFGFLVDGHDSHADVQRAMEFPSLNLKHNKECFK